METRFGDFIKTKRQEKNLTQKELANLVYVTESAVSKWERNVAYPDITLLPQLANILDVTEHELITASIDSKTREEKKQAKKMANIINCLGLVFWCWLFISTNSVFYL